MSEIKQERHSAETRPLLEDQGSSDGKVEKSDGERVVVKNSLFVLVVNVTPIERPQTRPR